MRYKQLADRLTVTGQKTPELIGDPLPEECLVELIKCTAFERRQKARTRSWLAKALVPGGLVAVAAAGIVSLATGSVTPVLAVWGVVGPIVVGITAYYFPSGASP